MSHWQREQEYRAEAAASNEKGSSGGKNKSGGKKGEGSSKGSGGGYDKPSGKSWSSPSSHQYQKSTEGSLGVNQRPGKRSRGNTTTNTIRIWVVKKDNSVASGAKTASPAGTAVAGQCSAPCSHQSSRAAPSTVAPKHSAPGEGKVGRNLRVARRKVLRNKKRREEKQSGVSQAEPGHGEGRTGRNQRVAKQKIRRNERLYDELCETAQRLSETHIDTDEELYDPPLYNTCKICGEFSRVPHRWCFEF